ncbi:hypothetical protein Hdeb2414_s0012g00392151 [Helianthus debilis subsp. tardiflorus]
MSTGERHEESSEEMPAGLPPLKWPKEIFDSMVRNFKFPDSWGARYPDEGQTAADAPAGYITLFWDFFAAGNFRLPITKFFLEILSYYKFHIYQMHPIGMVRVRYFEFVCRLMHIEPTRASAKRILLQPPKSFHVWKPKFFFIKACVIPMKMTFRGKEDVATETTQTPFSKAWYQDLKDVPSIELPEKALVGAGMSLFWWMDREDKPLYMEDGRRWSDGYYPKKADEELWYLRIVKNFALPRDEDLAAQPPTGAVVKKPKAEPQDATDIPASNADDPIDLESSLEPLLKTKAGKRKQAEVDAAAHPAKEVQRRKISRRGNLYAFIVKPPLEKPVSPVHAEPSSAVNEDLPSSPPRAPVSEHLENTKAAEAGNPEVENPFEVVVETEKVVDPDTVEVDSAHPKSPEVVARDPEKEKSAQEDPSSW